MNILALDTSMGACSAAVLRTDGAERTLFVRQEAMARGHAEALMPMVAETMAEASLPFAELDVIAATTGPGSFTGVRIAIAAARGLALVTGAGLFGTDSLTVMAKAAEHLAEPFAVAVDARRGMLYFGLYDADAQQARGPAPALAGRCRTMAAGDASPRGRQRRRFSCRSCGGKRAPRRGQFGRASAQRRSTRPDRL